MLETNLTNGKKVCIQRSFLVINVCNQGEILYSPCSFGVKNGWSYNSTPYMCIRSVYSDGLTFFIYFILAVNFLFQD